MPRPADIVVFLGPSLPRDEARRLLRADYRAPAGQGDVWRAMSSNPRAIVLIDGVFESQPSVWHHEVRTALDAGIAVYGASSMGALRAAELSGHGMIGVGEVFTRYQSGELLDDAEVALLQGPADFGFRALTIPLVNIRVAAERGVAAQQFSARVAREWVRSAGAIFYQQRTWSAVRRALATSLDTDAVAQIEQWWLSRTHDVKADDARACLRAVASRNFVQAPTPVRVTQLSAAAYWRWLEAVGAQEPVSRDDMLLAEFARSRGLRADPSTVQRRFEALCRRGTSRALSFRWAHTLALADRARTERQALTAGRS